MTSEMQAKPPYDQLMATLFQGSSSISQGEGQIVAVTSANPGEGVTHVAASLGGQLALHPLNRVAVITAQSLQEYTGIPESIGESCQLLQGKNTFSLVPHEENYAVAPEISLWQGGVQYRRECLQQLRRWFTHVLIDCPPPRVAGDLYSLAPLVDRVLLVVEANKTKKGHILNLERAVQAAHGHIAGYVVNKREYLVPQWLYSRL